MKRARDVQKEAVRQAALTRVASTLTKSLPGLGTREAFQAIEEADAARGVSLRHLDEYLTAQPNALRIGDSHCPVVIVRLARVLHGAGHTAVVRPSCTDCGAVDAKLPRLGPNGRLCASCGTKRLKGTCDRCGRTGVRIAARRPEGRICYPCYRTDPEVVEKCAGCGRLRAPTTRRPDNSPLCDACWEAPQHTCTSCGATRRAKSNGSEGPLCGSCYYQQQKPIRSCGLCGQVRRIARQGVRSRPDICEDCYAGPKATCAYCGRIRPCQRRSDGRWSCRSCRPGTPQDCCRCGKNRPIQTHWPIGPVCSACYIIVLESPASCSECGRHQPLIGTAESGAGICSRCAGTTFNYTCRTCGQGARIYADAQCARCVLSTRLDQLLSGPDNRVHQQLEPLRRALASADRPRGVLLWLRRSPNADLLTRLAGTGEPITHDQLDQLPPSRYLHHVRQILVHTGALPERDEGIDRIPAWLETVLVDRPTHHAQLIRPYVHWFLLRRARRRATQRRLPAAAGPYLRMRTRVALDFLDWLDARGLALGELRQSDLERWLESGSTCLYDIRYFLSWATGRGLTSKLAVPSRPRQNPSSLLDEDERWQLLSRCLSDETMPLDTRAAGALILLFGLTTSRIRHLTTGQLTRSGEFSYLTIDRHPVLLPPRLAKILHKLADAPRTRAALTRASRGEPWLFPGLVPGQPIATSAFSVKLHQHGIVVRPARNAALVALATDLPAPVLADALGLHTGTAVRWANFSKASWADYLAARAATLRPRHTTPQE